MLPNEEFRIQNADGVRRRSRRVRVGEALTASSRLRVLRLCLHSAFCMLNFTAMATAQPAPNVTEIRIEQESRVVTDETIASLIETTVGKPLDIRLVRESIEHLNSLNRYDDVRVYRDDTPGGVRVRYVLYPSHPVDKLEFRGMVALSEDDLRRAVRDRLGVTVPPARRQDDAARVLNETYRARGYPQATVTPRIEETHNPDRASMVFDVQAGPRVSIARVAVNQTD